MKNKRPLNFYAGPAIIPFEVMEKAKEELLDFNGTGLSILEISHRSKNFDEVIKSAQKKIKNILNLSDDYSVLFLQGGASSQFAMIPLNFLNNKKADYINTGEWAKKAIKEANILGEANIAGSSEDKNFTYIPTDFNFSSDAAYVHLTSNETINGIQWKTFPDTGSIPLIADMSSDIMSREFDANKFSMIYAGAQKNLGIAGLTLVIIKKEFAEKGNQNLPTMYKYKTHIDKESLYNTPTVFAIYITNLILDWIIDKGGLKAIEKINNEKAKTLYDVIDNSSLYIGIAEKDSRSKMNVTFKIEDSELEKKFLQEATENGFIGLKGHRSLGGCRASIYNAMSLEGVKELAEFMKLFEQKA